MPPRPIVSREDLLDAAILIIRESGFENLNARSLAEKLSCSTKPLFRLYSNMDDLKKDVYKKAEECYESYLSVPGDGLRSPFLQMGLNYIRFSNAEKNLFRFLFLSGSLRIKSFHSIADMAEAPEMIKYLMESGNLTQEKARSLFAGMWSVTHGVSCMIATGQYEPAEEEITGLLQTAFRGMLHELKRGKNSDEKTD